MKDLRVIIFLSFFFPFLLFSQGSVWLQPNRGQWPTPILYRVQLTQGNFFVEKGQFTFALNNHSDIYKAQHHGSTTPLIHRHHVIRSKFLNSSWKGEVQEKKPSSFYRNYFLGNDSSKWQSKVHSYKTVELLNYYPGIDMIIQTTDAYIKYSFRVHPGSDPNSIKVLYKGMSGLSLKNNELKIKTRFGPIIENGLSVYTIDSSGNKRRVPSQFQLSGDTLSFDLLNEYDHSKTLIIDPNLVFSTFTGSTADNWGFTATPAKNGALIAGGIVFGVGYPITTGAYDGSYNNGVIGGTTSNFKIDIAISKFSSDGSQLLYSTLLGGTANETPNSIIVNDQNELYILGVSASTDFPTTPGAIQTVNHGGNTITLDAVKFGGTDIIVSRLSADGTQLLSSTLLGGSENDGLNLGGLDYNYGDNFRGDIIFDNSGNVLITSSTNSSDFPIVGGSGSLGGSQDGIVAKLSPSLTSIIWSNYIGGSGVDAGYSIAVSSTNKIYVTGGTQSTNLTTTGGYKTSYQGGSDGFILELDGSTPAIIHGTYIGTNSYDQSYFIDLDQADNIYVFGQTAGNILISPNVYSNPSSGQFIQQYSSDLSTLNWSTVIGGGHHYPEISPTAFMVSDCNEIYFTGWGGVVNQNNSKATHSTTNGFPVTSDAVQSTTNGSNFYIGVLAPNATALSYGTFMGGTSSSYNHVDGGTSRFDKNGSIYHAVCGACGGDAHGFITTPGAYSETNNSFNCNLAAWKFDLKKIHAAVSLPDPYICLPDSVFFNNNSINGNSYYWDFGDGTTSSSFSPDHFYSQPGTYNVKLIVSDVNGCVLPDTSEVQIVVSEYNGTVTPPSHSICPGEGVQLHASGGSSYQWSPASVLDDPTSPTPIATVDTTTEFSVIVSDSCGIDTLYVTVQVYDDSVKTTGNFSICKGDTVPVWAVGGVSYHWTSNQPSSIIGSPDKDTIYVAPKTPAKYVVLTETAEGCTLKGVVNIQVVPSKPFVQLPDTLPVCEGSTKLVNIVSSPPSDSTWWTPSDKITPNYGSNVTVLPDSSQWYFVHLKNICGVQKDSTFVQVIIVPSQAGNDTIVCPGQKVQLWAKGGIQYAWYPKNLVDSSHSPNTTAKPKKPTNFIVQVMDKNGCIDFDTVWVDLFPKPWVVVSPSDYYGLSGDKVQLEATGNDGDKGIYTWNPTEYLSCVNCSNPIAQSPNPIIYTVTYEDENGCEAKARVTLHFDPLIYVPNTFTPDNTGVNDLFWVIAGNINDFHISIFNRWGELIFESSDIHQSWDGTYKGLKCPDGTYVWKIKYRDNNQNELHKLVGHINLLR